MGSKVQPTGWWSSPGPPLSLRSGWPNVLGTCQLLSWSPGVGPEGPWHSAGCALGSEVLPTGPSDTPG